MFGVNSSEQIRRISNPLALLCILLASTPMSATAALVENLFEVEMQVPDESREIRRAAMADGLAEILIRISGDRSVLQKIEQPNAASYVKQYRYVAAATGKTKSDEKSLWLQYNATRVMDYLRNQSIPVWSQHRSEVVVWLAVRDGKNQYVLSAKDKSALKTEIEKAMHSRGIPLRWPLQDQQERQQLRFADIWGGFREPLLQASARYSQGPVLAGSLTWNGKGWLGDWYLFMGQDAKRWNISSARYSSLIVDAVNLAADEMGTKYAALETIDPTQVQRILVEIEQVASIDKFSQVQKYLSGLTSVRHVQLARVDTDRVMFDIALRSRVEDFLRLLEANTRLSPIVEAHAAAVTPMQSAIYRYRLIN